MLATAQVHRKLLNVIPSMNIEATRSIMGSMEQGWLYNIALPELSYSLQQTSCAI